ncbi:MAG TPA: hypothetical protein VIH99_02360 [Bdellovibrionota bacterium]|jgi:hypothetical protein
MKRILFLAVLFLGAASAHARDYNAYVLEAVKEMPDGGRYSKLEEATIALGKSIFNDRGWLKQNPLVASPVYCSGASYQAFIHVISRLQQEGSLRLSDEAVAGLLVHQQLDGTDTWGRWNSNGPGTSRLFYELGLGTNSMDWKDAKPGDFLKIFFNEHIGKLERGHSVVYLGSFRREGVDYFRYWSSDSPLGRGTHEMARSRAIRVIFSRLQHPEALNKIPSMPKSDAYLASMLTQASTLEEMQQKIGLR